MRRSEETAKDLAEAQAAASACERQAAQSGTKADFEAYRAARDDAERLSLVHRHALALEEAAAAKVEAARRAELKVELDRLTERTTKAGREKLLEEPKARCKAALVELMGTLMPIYATANASDREAYAAGELARKLGIEWEKPQGLDHATLTMYAIHAEITAELTASARQTGAAIDHQLSYLAGKLVEIILAQGGADLSNAAHARANVVEPVPVANVVGVTIRTGHGNGKSPRELPPVVPGDREAFAAGELADKAERLRTLVADRPIELSPRGAA